MVTDSVKWPATMPHIRKPSRDRRSNLARLQDGHVEPRTICGSAATIKDWTIADAKRATTVDKDRFDLCRDCEAIMEVTAALRRR